MGNLINRCSKELHLVRAQLAASVEAVCLGLLVLRNRWSMFLANRGCCGGRDVDIAITETVD